MNRLKTLVSFPQRGEASVYQVAPGSDASSGTLEASSVELTGSEKPDSNSKVVPGLQGNPTVLGMVLEAWCHLGASSSGSIKFISKKKKTIECRKMATRKSGEVQKSPKDRSKAKKDTPTPHNPTQKRKQLQAPRKAASEAGEEPEAEAAAQSKDRGNSGSRTAPVSLAMKTGAPESPRRPELPAKASLCKVSLRKAKPENSNLG
ncbi:PREDICTED: histone H1oo-like [Elephantulus edwardii]|uniref:histone H1oo-like n=1 Tax=Elephantulus edwardii TaxID=28737 RepID=UPI0003F0C5F4|nr:PREDICTED: histone H1oo-like [Elephantulus edwardii]